MPRSLGVGLETQKNSCVVLTLYSQYSNLQYPLAEIQENRMGRGRRGGGGGARVSESYS